MYIKEIDELEIRDTPWQAIEGEGYPWIADRCGWSVAQLENCGAPTSECGTAYILAKAPELYEMLRYALLEECDGCEFAKWSNEDSVKKCDCRCEHNWQCPVPNWRKVLIEAAGGEVK